MSNRVTIQDIADALGVSRNTVSKAINNTGVLADSTREKVLQKAAEMGYKQFSYLLPSAAPQEPALPVAQGEIALFTGIFLGQSHFALSMLDKFQHELALLGYSLSMHRVTEYDIHNLTLPLSFDPERTAGIICVEIFDYGYCQMLTEQNIPLLLVDAPAATYGNKLNSDILLMDNCNAIYNLVADMKKRGFTRIGFLGNAMHCRSFFERYLAFRNAMFINDLPLREDYCMTEAHYYYNENQEYIGKALQNMDVLPELIICSNDFVAMDLMSVLRQLEINCPETIQICGFDDSPEAKHLLPPLTTIHIHSQIMGYSATQLLVSRIQQPDMNYRTVYAETDLIFRESTI